MITNQVMKRPMGNFLVEQRTKDSMFNATNLLKQWNEASGEKKEITKFFDNDNTKEFISALMEEEKLNTQNSAYLKARGKNGGTWMHPILFVKFAMWLNPRFEVQVIKFVYDQMLKYRNDAGDAYKELGAAISKIVSKKFMHAAMCKIAKAINYVVFNEHEHEMRNKPEEIVEKQRSYWQGGNKNELVVCVGIDKNKNVKWCNAFSWCDSPVVGVKSRDWFMSNPVNLEKYAEYIGPIVEKEWHRKNFEDFDYLTIELTDGQYWAIIVLLLIFNIGMSFWIVTNNYKNDL